MALTFGTHHRNDHEPGYVYLIEAQGFHGIIPGRLLRRCKIGLSRDPELRRQNFVDSQFPCDVEIITTIYVEDMAEVETELHQIFKACNVTLEKSREWFDLSPWQYLKCLWAFRQREAIVFSLSDISWKIIPVGITAIFITGYIGATVVNTVNQPVTEQVETIEEKK